jgi:hypothetical protein
MPHLTNPRLRASFPIAFAISRTTSRASQSYLEHPACISTVAIVFSGPHELSCLETADANPDGSPARQESVSEIWPRAPLVHRRLGSAAQAAIV